MFRSQTWTGLLGRGSENESVSESEMEQHDGDRRWTSEKAEGPEVDDEWVRNSGNSGNSGNGVGALGALQAADVASGRLFRSVSLV